jgi:asparagine synthase (glutamine-hydrolysing)
MCGITGFVGKGSRTDLLAMVDQLRHRGPDSEGLWWEEKKHVYLGHRRLAIIDLIDGHQPMWTADDKLGVVFNGEIYNHGQLRAELEAKGYVFATDHSDTEVLLHGYREWQEELPEHLNGMWAFVIYDTLRRQLFVSRDRFGKKPLYYTRQDGIFAFASELTSLMKHGSLTSTVSQLSL